MTIEQILKLGEMGYTKEEISRLEQEQTEVQNQPQQEQTTVQNQPQQEQTTVQNQPQQEQTTVQNQPQQEQTTVQNQNEIFKALLTELGAIKGAIQNSNAATLTQPTPKQENASTILASLLVPPTDKK